jgi:hypothetical protein
VDTGFRKKIMPPRVGSKENLRPKDFPMAKHHGGPCVIHKVNDVRKEDPMRKLLFATAATLAIAAAVPASAQVYIDRHGVEVGPLRFGEHGWRDRWRHDYAEDCRVVRERIVTPSGRVVYETRRDCD